MFERFLKPYLTFLIRAAWNIQQNLVGTGSWSTDDIQFDRHEAGLHVGWNPAASMLPLLGFLIVLVLCGLLLLILTGYVLGRKRGAFITVAVLMLPGMLGLAGLWPTISPSPVAFEIGAVGAIGDVMGTLPLIVIAVIAGWSVTILIVDSFCIRRRFWDLFDHFWLVLGLVAVIFFVSDANVAQNDRDYSEAERDTQKASAYLLKQVDAYGKWCHETSHDDLLSCQWASGVHQTLLNASFESANLFGYFGPKSTKQLYGWFGNTASAEQKFTIRTEIASYNHMICPVIKFSNPNAERVVPSPRCEETPAVFLRAWPEPMNGKVLEDRCEQPIALDSECLIPALVYLHRRDADLASRSEREHRSKNYRWMYYLFFSAGLGAKLAGSTIKLTALDERTGDEARRSMRALRRIASRGFLVLRNLSRNFGRFVKRAKY